MNADYYFIHEVRNVLFAHLISPRLAASQFARPGSVTLSSPEGLKELATHRRKLLQVTGLPLDRRRTHEAEPVHA